MQKFAVNHPDFWKFSVWFDDRIGQFNSSFSAKEKSCGVYKLRTTFQILAAGINNDDSSFYTSD